MIINFVIYFFILLDRIYSIDLFFSHFDDDCELLCL